MSRDTFYRQVDQIQQEILLLESMVEQAVLKSVQNLKSRNLNEARQLYDDDVLLNEKRFAIENAVLILIATQQPMARDLRKLAAILEIGRRAGAHGRLCQGHIQGRIILRGYQALPFRWWILNPWRKISGHAPPRHDRLRCRGCEDRPPSPRKAIRGGCAL